MGGAGQPMDDLSIRFPMCFARVSILAYVFQCFGAFEVFGMVLGGPEQVPGWPMSVQEGTSERILRASRELPRAPGVP